MNLIKMNLSKIKSIIILFLAVLTIYQTGFLWFFNITGHTFLLNYFPFMQQVPVPEGAYNLVMPKRIIAAHKDGRFSVLYNGLQQADSFKYSHMVLSDMFQRGRFVAVHTAGLEAMLAFLGSQLYIYEYAFSMEAEWFTFGFGERGNVLTRPGVGSFRQIIICPPAYGETDIRIFFLCESGYAYEFAVALTDDIPRHNVGAEAIGAYYTFEDGKFIRYSHFYGIAVSNPYADAHGAFSLSFIQDRVSGFFSNPAAIRDMAADDVWVYRDVNTVVRYYVTHVLEYISYRAVDRSAPSLFLNDYIAAFQFIERDHLIINEMYLARHREENGRRIFYFNYVVGNMPLTMPDNWPENAPLIYPIVVTVEHGTVIRYRKIAFNFYATHHDEGESHWINFQG